MVMNVQFACQRCGHAYQVSAASSIQYLSSFGSLSTDPRVFCLVPCCGGTVAPVGESHTTIRALALM